MRIYIELRRGESAEVVLNNLFLHTALQCVFGVNMVALVEGQPRLLNLKQVLEAFLAHRREVVVRRTVFELRKARERAHIVEGLAVALANLDPLIALIRAAADPAAARAALLEQVWRPGLVTDLLARAGADAVAARGSAGGIRPERGRLPAVAGPGPGDSGPAAAPADRPGTAASCWTSIRNCWAASRIIWKSSPCRSG